MGETPITNDEVELTPVTELSGRTLEYDFPRVCFGAAEYAEGATGCSVFHFPTGGARFSLDVRGGAPGIVGDYGFAHAICLAGGSLLGLEASAGVAAELFAMHGHRTEFWAIPLVTGGIVYDFGPRWGNAVYPDAELGRTALGAARHGSIVIGPHGAGRSASVGKALDLARAEPCGQGAAFRQIGDTKLLFFTVVNAMGAIVDRDGSVRRGQLDRASGARLPVPEALEQQLASGRVAPTPGGNTTLSVLITNQKLDGRSLSQLGRAVHSSMARAIVPFHTPDDGDALWCVTTDEVEADDGLGVTHLSIVAAELAWDAVLSSFDPPG